ncbi:MAG: sulfur carrier protein ThiS [Oscillospiraceae bacterium]
MVRINGEQVQADGMTVSEYLAQEKLDPRTVAVMLGENIVPKGSYDSTVLSDGDKLEVVGFVGGG